MFRIFLIITVFALHCVFITPADAQSKKPMVFKASPELIAALRARELEKEKLGEPAKDSSVSFEETLPQIAIEDVTGDNITKAPLKSVEAAPLDDQINDTITEDNLPRLSRQDILDAIAPEEKKFQENNDPIIFKEKPVVKEKPVIKASHIVRPPKVPQRKKETSAPIETSVRETLADKLISFYLEPNQIHLDENLKSFLENKAIATLKENKDLQIEIRSFATPVNNEKYSDVRLSLARALEVRSFLIEHQIDPVRLKLVHQTETGLSNTDDRIDLLFQYTQPNIL